MKKVAALLVVSALVFPFVFASAGGNDCFNVVGSWNFDLGGGHKASVTYSADGKFVQKMPGMDLHGTYVQNGKSLKTDVSGKATDFTIVSCAKNSLTLKRNKDGRTMVYTK